MRQAGAFIVVTLSLAPFLAACGTHKFSRYAAAFDPPGREVVVVTALDTPKTSTSGPVGSGEGLVEGVKGSTVALLSIYMIPLIPFILYGNVTQGAEMAAFIEENPHWHDNVRACAQQQVLPEILRSNFQRHLQPTAVPQENRLGSVDGLLQRLAREPRKNQTILAITGVRLDLERSGCPNCVRFFLTADLTLIDGESATVMVEESYGTRLDWQPAPLSYWLAERCERYNLMLETLAEKLAANQSRNFRVQR